MVVVAMWTGQEARALRIGLRMTIEAFAEHLGAAVRTVARWEAEGSKTVPLPTMQEALDTVLERATPTQQSRFEILRGRGRDAVAGSGDVQGEDERPMNGREPLSPKSGRRPESVMPLVERHLEEKCLLVIVLEVLSFRIAAAKRRQRLTALVEGFRDHVVSQLSKLPGVIIVAPAEGSDRGTSRGESTEGVSYQLFGKLVQLEPERHDLSVQLVEVRAEPVANAVRWAETFLLTDHELVNALTTISMQVANALKLALPTPRSRAPLAADPDPTSYQRFLRALSLLSTNEEADLTSGLALLKSVVKASPDFADGHALYGYASWRQYFAGWGGDVRALAEARFQATEALRLDETCTWARMTLIRILWDLGQHEQAIAEGIRAVEDAPGHIEARLALARALNNAGMADLSLPLTEEVLAVDPANPVAQKLRIWNLLMVRRLPDAASIGSAYLRQHPGDSNTAWAVTMTQALLGDVEAGAWIAERSLRADQANFSLWLLLGYVQLAGGDESGARRTWERGARAVLGRLGEASTNYRALAYVANMYAALGQRNEALDIAKRIELAEPYNGYLNYRLAHVFSELGETERAVRSIELAADSGFLSVQMLGCEEQVCALSRLARGERYREAVSRLGRRVEELRTQYGEMLPAFIARGRPPGGSGASSPPL